MCKWGTDAPVALCRPREHSGRIVVMVDACIASQVQKLNDQGIWTLGCCCGHGKEHPHALIHSTSAEFARALGYQTEPYGEQSYKVRLVSSSEYKSTPKSE